MQNKTIIFDWSGTLNDNFHLFCKICDLIFSELGKEPISADEIKTYFTLPYMKFWNRYFPDLTKDKQDIIFEKYVHQVGDPKLYRHAKEVIDYLHQNDYRLFILSSDPASKLIPEIEKSGFSKLMTRIMPDTYEKEIALVSLIKEFDLDKNNTFYIGDTSGDIEAGQAAGVKTIGISWGFQHKDILSAAKPDFLIDDIIEIKNIIEEKVKCS